VSDDSLGLGEEFPAQTSQQATDLRTSRVTGPLVVSPHYGRRWAVARFGKDDRIGALERISLFEGLSKRELGFLAQQVTEVVVAEGTELVTQGELGREAIVLMEGSAVVRRNSRKIAELGPGDVFGEMSLINRVPRNATVTASSPLTVLVMDAREFSSVISANQRLAVKLLKTVATRLAENESSVI